MNKFRLIRWLIRWSAFCAVLVCPSWALSQANAQIKSKTASHAPQTKMRARPASVDITAQLQAQAAAQAAARVQVAAMPSKMVRPVVPMPAPMPAMATLGAATQFSGTAAVLDSTTQADQGPVQAAPQDQPELLIAQQIHQGQLPCEMGTSVRIEADTLQPGFFHVLGKGFRYRMFPVLTSSGALRLEDKKAGAVWLQLANKSMLMDQKKGKRLADECAHPDQLAYAKTMKTNPPPSLIDTQGMGR